MASPEPPEPGTSPPPKPPAADVTPAIRVGDAERQAVVARLQRALDEGRLDLHEFDERAAVAYAARTEADLVPLTADLPAQPGNTPRPPVAGSAVAEPVKRPGRLSGSESSWLRIAIILTVIWLVTSVARGHVTFFWPIFPIGIWGAVLLANRLTGRRD
ncbi:DUF1707 SHOCT-like domain-containing protein [Cryptosporangium phraense]|uniref:DUF1707 domain-containing protein n=1 Tax=Cryptosporangium phraense TaxID=2593070 RepID=A0A545AYI6_9ACTN|nr:DUF1707 domain-containing protein [Cryptosporangium phraense]TQS46371.1 DUF1707 domain-containing protein [Cryptosporangium phraense]